MSETNDPLNTNVDPGAAPPAPAPSAPPTPPADPVVDNAGAAEQVIASTPTREEAKQMFRDRPGLSFIETADGPLTRDEAGV